MPTGILPIYVSFLQKLLISSGMKIWAIYFSTTIFVFSAYLEIRKECVGHFLKGIMIKKACFKDIKD